MLLQDICSHKDIKQAATTLIHHNQLMDLNFHWTKKKKGNLGIRGIQKVGVMVMVMLGVPIALWCVGAIGVCLSCEGVLAKGLCKLTWTGVPESRILHRSRRSVLLILRWKVMPWFPQLAASHITTCTEFLKSEFRHEWFSIKSAKLCRRTLELWMDQTNAATFMSKQKPTKWVLG